jgi:hypothetical protein
MTRPTQDEFLKDVSKHAMEVLRDDGVYRHLIFRQPENSWLHRVEIVTWPGVLCIRGDMGSYVFSRTLDMFEFFRYPKDDGKLYINDGYWSEKLVASDCYGRRGDGVMRFNPDVFRDEVKRRYVEHVRANMREMPDERQSLRRALEDEVLACADDGEHAALQAAGSFEHDGFMLTDFWEVEVRTYSVQFIWSLYAIVWAIQQFDNRAAPMKSAAA